MKGWHHEPQRHSLAARGFKTVDNRFVFEPNRRRTLYLLDYKDLKPDGKYHLVKKRVWNRDVRGRGRNVTGLFSFIESGVSTFSSEEKNRKIFGYGSELYTKKKPEHGFGYIVEPGKNRVRAIQIIDIEDDVFSKYSSGCFIDRCVNEIREEHPKHKVITREIDIPISRLSRENPNSYFAGMRYAFDNEGDIVEHIISFVDEHMGPKMNYVVINSYKNRKGAYEDWKERNKEIDNNGDVDSEYTRWLFRHQRLL